MSDNNNIIDKPILDETGTLTILYLLSFCITFVVLKILYDDITKNKNFTILQRTLILVISLTSFPSCAYYLISRVNK